MLIEPNKPFNLVNLNTALGIIPNATCKISRIQITHSNLKRNGVLVCFSFLYLKDGMWVPYLSPITGNDSFYFRAKDLELDTNDIVNELSIQILDKEWDYFVGQQTAYTRNYFKTLSKSFKVDTGTNTLEYTNSCLETILEPSNDIFEIKSQIYRFTNDKDQIKIIYIAHTESKPISLKAWYELSKKEDVANAHERIHHPV